MSALFSPQTFRTLQSCGLRTAEVAGLEKLARDLVHSSPPRLPTRAQARDDACRFDDLAEKLARLLDESAIAPQLPMIAKLVDGVEGLDVGLLREQLQKLSDAALALLVATGDDEARPQIELRSPTVTRNEPAVTALASGVLWALHVAGQPITTGESGAAVECVAAVFADAGITADARTAVRGWIRRHAEPGAHITNAARRIG